MTIAIDYDEGIEKDKAVEELIEKVILASLDYEKCPYESEVNVVLTDDDNIHEMNLEYREIDRATDVLSFPLVDYDAPADFSHLEDGENDYFNFDSGELMLGDIVISTQTARRQAEEYGHSYLREIGFLTAHSMLHLMGYDHMEDDERVVMERKQEEILNSLGITRNGIDLKG